MTSHAPLKARRSYLKPDPRNVNQVAVVDKISLFAVVSDDIANLLHPHLFIRARNRFRNVEVRQPDVIWNFYL